MCFHSCAVSSLIPVSPISWTTWALLNGLAQVWIGDRQGFLISESLPMPPFKPSLWPLRITNGGYRPHVQYAIFTTVQTPKDNVSTILFVTQTIDMDATYYERHSLSCPHDRVPFHLYHFLYTVSEPRIPKESFSQWHVPPFHYIVAATYSQFILDKYTSKPPQLANSRLYHHPSQLWRHRHHSLQTRLLRYAVAKPEGLFPTNSLSPIAPIWREAMVGTPYFLGKDGWRSSNRY